MTIEWNFILRLLVAGLLGGAIGFEREFRAKEAGVRTHFIVALGSALFMIISQYAFSGQYDHSRVAAQVVSGIGFIGAGVIIFQKNVVRGITTAAGLWVAAAIRLFVSPLVLVAMMFPFRRSLDADMMLAMVIAASAPVAAMTSIFAAKFRRDVDAGVAIVSGTTLASIATMPFVIAFAKFVL